MKTINTLAVGMLVAASAMFGCGQSQASAGADGVATVAREGKTQAASFTFGAGGVKATSRVTRQIAPSGEEILTGTTEVTLAGAAHPSLLTERAELDAHGKLLRAKSELRTGPGGVTRSVDLDARSGTITVREAASSRTLRMPADHPWIYGSMFSDIAPQVSSVTAVQAWVARRAASTGDRLRYVDVLAARSSLTIPEQVVFSEGDTDLVVLGDEVIATD
ncbi:MAG: hypothetical protein R3F14_28600, partial [Polyangiaceae bacterium]